ncbi:MAG: tetratricopeptide repeat protein [Myxococcales bacterium]|nr:tetratricopeptide repeat protein [Myxococcales bacterium]
MTKPTLLLSLVSLTLLACSGQAPGPDAAKSDAKTEAKTDAAKAETKTETAQTGDAPTGDTKTGGGIDSKAVAEKKAAAKSKFASRDDEAVKAGKATMLGALNEGRKLTKEDKLDEAIAKYEALLAIDPHYGPALGELGWAEYKAGRYEKSQAHTLQALAQAPDDKRRGMFYYNLGRVAEDRNQTDKAIEYYALSLSFRPNETVADRLALISHVEDAGGMAFEHPAVEEYRSKFGAEAKPAPYQLSVLASGLPSAEAGCKAAYDECATGEDNCSFVQGADASWGYLDLDDMGMMRCVHPVVKHGDGWAVYSAMLAGQHGSEVDQDIDALSARVVSNDAGTFLIFDYSEHIYERDWGWGDFEEGEEIPEGNWADSEGMIICKAGDGGFCTGPIARKSDRDNAGQKWGYQATVELEGDVVVISDVQTSGAVEFGLRGSVWDITMPLPEGRYPLAELK